MVRKPNIIKGIPALLVRALPTIFYFGRYAGEKIPANARAIVKSHINYLTRAIQETAKVLQESELESIAAQVAALATIHPSQIEPEVYRLSALLSGIFSRYKEVARTKLDENEMFKDMVIDLFRATAQRPHIAIVDNNNELEWTDKLATTLRSSCYYETDTTRPLAENFSDVMLLSDFILFASATPQSIHEDAACLKNYHKPGLILGTLKKDEKLDQQTIRNGAWLRSRGYDVLFKLFSPLRLFTSIDKIYIRFLLQQ
ncbi:MAG: hypothetical protein ONB27_12945 [candidate division KSB1 bacterium]|nr:hypothetical protein [candidate division KSB1 bacterium]